MEGKEGVKMVRGEGKGGMKWKVVVKGMMEGEGKVLEWKWCGVEGGVKGV